MRPTTIGFAVLVFATVALAAVPVQFFDGQGNLITGRAVDVTATNPATGGTVKLSLPADPDGTYDVPASPGDEVRFLVDSGGRALGSGSEGRLKIPQPQTEPLVVVVAPQGSANDACTSPQPVTVGSVTSDTTVGATPDAQLFCGTSNTAPGVWFSVIANGFTMLTASTCETVGNPPGSSAYDTKISVYCQDCGAPTCVAGNDDSPGCNFHSAVSWCAAPGTPYRILVHGFGVATGNFGLSVSSNGQSCTPTVSCSLAMFGACCLTAEPPFEEGEVPVACVINEGQDCVAAGGAWQGFDTTCVVPVNPTDIVVNPALPIPDNAPAGVNSTINVTQSLIVSDVNVDVGITHTWVSDLIIEVTGPTGASQVLWNQVCGGTDNINTTFDDSGTELSCAVIASGPIDSVFLSPVASGDGPLAIFNGTNAQGNWTLNVSDNFLADIGTLNQWSLHLIEGVAACAPFECPASGGSGGTGGSGGCPDEDEDSDGSHVTVEVEGADGGGAPIDVGPRSSSPSPANSRGAPRSPRRR